MLAFWSLLNFYVFFLGMIFQPLYVLKALRALIQKNHLFYNQITIIFLLYLF